VIRMEGGRDIGKGGAASNVAEERCRGRGVQVLQRKGGERVRMGYGWVRRGSESRATRQGRGLRLDASHRRIFGYQGRSAMPPVRHSLAG